MLLLSRCLHCVVLSGGARWWPSFPGSWCRAPLSCSRSDVRGVGCHQCAGLVSVWFSLWLLFCVVECTSWFGFVGLQTVDGLAWGALRVWDVDFFWCWAWGVVCVVWVVGGPCVSPSSVWVVVSCSLLSWCSLGLCVCLLWSSSWCHVFGPFGLFVSPTPLCPHGIALFLRLVPPFLPCPL